MKYMGSKRRIAKYILPIILKNRSENQYYVEPFVGGCNVIDKVKGNRIGGEINKYVAAFLYELEKGWVPENEITESEWKHIQANKDDYPPHLVGYCGTQLSFGAVWFASYARDKSGKRNYFNETIRNIKKQKELLKGIKFINSCYSKLLIPNNSIIYCDPPYAGTDNYREFEKMEHDKFWQWCRDKAKDGHKVFVSEFTAPADFVCVWEMEQSSKMAEKKSKILTEKLFVHKSQIEVDRNLILGDLFGIAS